MNTTEKTEQSFGHRVRIARDAAGLSQAALARRVGIAQATIAQMETGRNEGSRHVATLALALGVSPTWLQTGQGPRTLASPRGNLEVVAAGSGNRVPLIHWEDLGRDIPEGCPGIIAPGPVTPTTFAVLLTSDSMEPRIPRGAYVFADPSVDAAPGRVVIARPNDHSPPVLRELVIDGAARILQPANPRHPIAVLEASGEVLAVATAVVLPLV